MSATLEPTHDEQVAFAWAMLKNLWKYDDEDEPGTSGAMAIAYFSEPHKFEPLFNKWKELGDVQFTSYMDRRCNKCGQVPEEGVCEYCEPVNEQEDARTRYAIYRAQTRIERVQ